MDVDERARALTMLLSRAPKGIRPPNPGALAQWLAEQPMIQSMEHKDRGSFGDMQPG